MFSHPDGTEESQLENTSSSAIKARRATASEVNVARQRKKRHKELRRILKLLKYNYISLGESVVAGSDRSLSTLEAEVVFKYLREVVEAGNELSLEAAVLALSGISTREYETLVRVLRGATCRHFEVNPGAGTWTTKLTKELGPALPSEAARRHLDPTARSMTFQLPLWLALRLSSATEAELHSLATAPPSALVQAICRKVDRFSCPRFRTVLPTQIIRIAEDTAAAQAICSDRLGPNRSDSSLHYFSIAAAQCDVFYRQAMEPLVGDLESPFGRRDRQFGMESPAVSQESIRTVAAFLRPPRSPSWFVWGMQSEVTESEAHKWMRELKELSIYSFLFLSAGSSLRPTTRGCQVRLSQLDLPRGIGCITDKFTDLTHAFRVLFWGSDTGRQIETYVTALSAFEHMWNRYFGSNENPVSQRVRQALDGSGPLFLVGFGGYLRALEPADLAEVMPHGLTPYHLRHRFDRRLRELGVRGIDVSNACGRYPVGQPFTAQTTESVWAVAKRLRPALAKLTRDDGWVVTELPDSPPERCAVFTPSLHCVADYRESRVAIAAEAKEMRLATRSLNFGLDGTSRPQIVREAIEQHCPELLSQQRGVEVSGIRLQRIVATARQRMRRDDEVLSAIRGEVIGQLSKIRTQLEWEVALPRREFRLSEGPPAVLPQQLQAACLLDIAEKRLWKRNGDVDPETFFLANIVCLGVTDEWRLRQAREAIPEAELLVPHYREAVRERTTSAPRPLPVHEADELFQGLVLLGLEDGGTSGKDIAEDAVIEDSEVGGDNVREVVGRKPASLVLSGRPAIALLLACKHSRSSKKARKDRELAKEKIVRALLGDGPDATWSNLLELVELAHPVRFGGPRVLGAPVANALSLPATRVRQILLGRDASSARIAALPEKLTRSNAPQQRKSRRLSAKEAELATKVSRLLKEWAEKSARRSGSFDAEIVAQMQGIVAEAEKADFMTMASMLRFCLRLIDRQLLTGVRDLMTVDVSSAKGEERLRPNSVLRYMSSLFIDLVRAAGTEPLESLSPEALEDVYLRFLSDKPVTARRYAYQRLREFHSYSLRHIKIDWSTIHDELPDLVDEPESSIVAANEVVRLRKCLAHWSKLQKAKLGSRFGARRYDIATLDMIFMLYAGLRIGEVTRLRFADIHDHGGRRIWLHVRTNQFGTVKSDAGNRLIDLGCCLSESDLDFLRAWLRDERRRQTELRVFEAQNPIFGSDDGNTPISREYHIAGLQAALVEATGCSDARPHWLRHTCCQGLLVAKSDKTQVAAKLVQIQVDAQGVSSPQLYGLWVAMRMGHALLSTTLINYFHLQFFQVAAARHDEFAELEYAGWADRVSLSPSTLRAWRMRFLSRIGWSRFEVDKSLFHRRVLASAWLIHLRRESGVTARGTSKREVGMRQRLPCRPEALKPFTFEMGVRLLVDAQDFSVAGLRQKFDLSASELRRVLESIVACSRLSGEWPVPQEKLIALLAECGVFLPATGVTEMRAPQLQEKALYAGMVSPRLDKNFLLARARSGRISEVLPHLFQPSRFLPMSPAEVAEQEAFERAGISAEKFPRRHMTVYLAAAQLVVVVEKLRSMKGGTGHRVRPKGRGGKRLQASV